MHMHARLAAVLGCVATLAMVGCSTNGGISPIGSTTQQQAPQSVTGGWIEKDGVVYHTPHYMITRQMAAQSHVPPPNLSYGGGPVLVKPHVYLIFWGYKTYGDTDGVEALLKAYTRNEGKTEHNGVYDQYYMINKTNSQQINITDPRRQRKGAWDDETNPVPNSPTDAQVATEALAGVAHFGYDPNGSYVVATPHLHSSAGFGTQFCAYHSSTQSSGKYVSYTNLPYMPDAGPSCGSSIITPPNDETGTDEGVTIVEGHEYGESITDPVPFSGWNSGAGEIGDLCAWQNIQNDPFHKKSYTMQPMWSNATSSCQQ